MKHQLVEYSGKEERVRQEILIEKQGNRLCAWPGIVVLPKASNSLNQSASFISFNSLVGLVRPVIYKNFTIPNIVYAVQLPHFVSFPPGLALYDSGFDLM